MDLDNNKPFIWRKKYEEQGIKIDEKEIEAEFRRRVEENRVELQKIRERQKNRELEYQQKLSDGEFLQRQKEAEQHEHWEQQEDDFVLKQHRHRSKIRIRDGRAKPIDLFAHYIDIFGIKVDSKRKDEGYLQEEKIDLSDSPVELLNPSDWFNGLRQSDLEALEPDIKIYMNADHEGNQQYWKDLLEISQNELSKLLSVKEQSDMKSANSGDINSAVMADVMSLFEGKSISELNELEYEMSSHLRDADPSVDVGFYQNALSRLRAYRARLRLTMNHKKNLRRQKDQILNKKDEKPKVSAQNDDIEANSSIRSTEKLLTQSSHGQEPNPDDEADLSNEEAEGEEDDNEANLKRFEETRSICELDYEKGGYSPKMYKKNQIDPSIICVDFEKEYNHLVHQRNQVCNASSLDEAKMATMTNEEKAFIDAASKGMNNQDEVAFSCEAAVRGPDNRALTYVWADKYQPRKPRYFNRVHTGFEWNKYNQTHYDIDNPPPKVVQGYKFNIFYPDLIDKSKAPTFTLTPCKDDKDFCVIRFSSGPPYEDIAFRIVDREWNNSHKSGYRCQFINSMLQLWFQFKRYRYRR